MTAETEDATDLFDLIRQANPERSIANLVRRGWKLMEELGEVAEAYLNVTSLKNGKGKTWDDVREEIADVLIVAVDIALTPQPGCAQPTFADAIWPLQWGLTPITEFDRLAFDIGHASARGQRFLREGCPDDADRTFAHAAHLATNLALTPMPDQTEASPCQLQAALAAEVRRKLAKWTRNRGQQSDVTEFVK